MAENGTMWSEEQLLASAWSALVDAFDRRDYAAEKGQPDLFEEEIRQAYIKVVDVETMIARHEKSCRHTMRQAWICF